MKKEKIRLTKRLATEWLEVEPYGVTASVDNVRPVMLFRVVDSEEILPVWLSPIDAGIALTQNHAQSAANSPHDITIKVLTQIGVKLEKCLFTEVRGNHQYVELHFTGHEIFKFIEARADQAISFCLQAGSKFYCRRAYIGDSKLMKSEMAAVTKDLRLNPSLAKNRHPYMN